MTDKEFHKLGRRELLQLLLAQAKEADELRTQLTETTEQLQQLQENYERLRKRLDHKDEQIHKLRDSLQAEKKKREIELEDAGSIAEASLRLNGIFEAAQRAADQYLDNVKMLRGDQMNGYISHEPVLTRTVSLAQDQTRNVMKVSQETVLKRVVNLPQKQETIVDMPVQEPERIVNVTSQEPVRSLTDTLQEPVRRPANLQEPVVRAAEAVQEPVRSLTDILQEPVRRPANLQEPVVRAAEDTREQEQENTVQQATEPTPPAKRIVDLPQRPVKNLVNTPQESLRNTADLPKQPVKNVVNIPQKPVKNLVSAVNAETARRTPPPSIDTESASPEQKPVVLRPAASEPTQISSEPGKPQTAEIETKVVEVVEVRLTPQDRAGRPYWPEVEEEPTIPEWADNVPKSRVPLPKEKVKLSRTLPAGHQARIRNFRIR